MLIASLLSWPINEIQKVPSGVVYPLVFLLVFGEAALFIGFVLPGETSVLVAGVVASQGHVNVFLLCALVVVAAVTGDSVGYFVGDRYGEKLLTVPMIKKRRVAIDRALAGLEKRGPTYVFVGRFTAFLRAVMPGLAGMSKMHYRRFLLANMLGGIIWGVGYTLIGYYAGSALKKIESAASYVGIGILGVIILVLLVMHFRKKKIDEQRDNEWLAENPNALAEDEFGKEGE
jgi:membrane protein DedA with SNARE-associated domain